MNTRTALERVFRLIPQVDLARELGVTPQAVNNWKVSGHIPATRVLAVEAATGGRVSRHQLRPDIYPSDTAA